jgi:hypothetical protein
MKYLVVDTARRNTKWTDGKKKLRVRANRRVRTGDYDTLPSREQIRPRGGRSWCEWKYMNLPDRLQPLFRYLEKQIGRPWNDVYSEICENLSPSSTMQKHILDHVEGYVERDPVYIELYSKQSGWGLYVDEYGILRKGKSSYKNVRIRPSRPQEPYVSRAHCSYDRIKKIEVKNKIPYEWIDGVWYRLVRGKTPAAPSNKGRRLTEAEIDQRAQQEANHVFDIKIANSWWSRHGMRALSEKERKRLRLPRKPLRV